MCTILIIEDDHRLASLLQTGIEEAGHQVLLAYDAEMALRLLKSENKHINLVISDIILPGMNGIELCKCIHTEHPQIPILMLTALGTTDDKLEGFDAGADDYMTKPFDFRELLARIAVLLKRRCVQNQPHASEKRVLEYGGCLLDIDRHECSRNGRQIRLTPKEFALLQYLMENADKVVSRADIQEKVWHTHFDTGTNFIDVYINYLRRKVDRDFSVKLIKTKPGIGFMLNDE
ncbi:response regulator transcription factor [Sodaliphilus sp.]|uniref:response regulator transcription factor n=1 Tax=Sodaliphilus sp. TaxID=2815818 RepID=UPI00388EC537